MKKGRQILLLLTLGFVLGEITFDYLILKDGDVDPFVTVIRPLFILLFILLFSKQLNWAKWTLSIMLTLYGLIVLLVGLATSNIAFYVIGSYAIIFAVCIHLAKALKIFRDINAIDNHKDNVENIEMSIISARYEYPLLVKRYKALLIDALLLFTLLITIMILTQDSENRTIVMVSSGLIILMAYEPILTAYSRTVGQRVMKIKVGKLNNPQERISLANAYLRWLTKGLLGWLSFLTINFNPEHRAIHDLASDAVMISED